VHSVTAGGPTVTDTEVHPALIRARGPRASAALDSARHSVVTAQIDASRNRPVYRMRDLAGRCVRSGFSNFVFIGPLLVGRIRETGNGAATSGYRIRATAALDSNPSAGAVT
jgi:hypothetical protein